MRGANASHAAQPFFVTAVRALCSVFQVRSVFFTGEVVVHQMTTFAP
jgi:hypothetical protein